MSKNDLMTHRQAMKAIEEAKEVYVYVSITHDEGMYVKADKDHVLKKFKGMDVEYKKNATFDMYLNRGYCVIG